jgi:hypothetical protein
VHHRIAPALLLAAAALPVSAAQARIEPERGIGGVRLGMTQAQAVAANGEAEVETLDTPQGRLRFLTWEDGLRATVTPGRGVTAVITSSRSERLASGVGVGSSERALRRALRVRCGTFSGRRSCTSPTTSGGGRATIFRIGPKTRRIFEVQVVRIG